MPEVQTALNQLLSEQFALFKHKKVHEKGWRTLNSQNDQKALGIWKHAVKCKQGKYEQKDKRNFRAQCWKHSGQVWH